MFVRSLLVQLRNKFICIKNIIYKKTLPGIYQYTIFIIFEKNQEWSLPSRRTKNQILVAFKF